MTDASPKAPAPTPAPAASPAVSPWAPLRHGAYAALWGATILSNVGTWMNDVGSGWLMTTLAPTPAMVSLVQASTTLPVFLFALLAGALADRVDRRRLLLVVTLFMSTVAGLLSLTVATGTITPPLLLAFTFLLGCGAAFSAPSWQAIVPGLVPKPELPAAIALNSMGINVSRAIGPALAGLLIVAVGLWSPFALNAASFVGIILALLFWKPPRPRSSVLPPEPLGRAIPTGLRYVLRSAPLRATLLRAGGFFLFASAYWAMLPLIARQVLAGGPGLYGILLGSVGVGAVGGALLLPPVRRRLGPDRTVALGTAGTAATLILFALLPLPAVAAGASLLAGASWIAVLSSLNLSAQTALPDWVRARGLSVFLTVFFGTMAAGSLAWGQVASNLGIPYALLIAAAGALLAVPLTWRWKLGQGEGLDLAPSLHWPAPLVSAEPSHDRGPVLVTVEYQVEPADAAGFLKALHRLAQQRYREGAVDWDVFEDAGAPGRWLETFRLPSWLDHLHQHERVTRADQQLQQAVAAFHRGAAPPRVRHLLAPARDS
ncbi:Predicted arabinose efflux permease, MFS family [Tistlia consotensis]|uniref:Predicted arabinose efflux permease, MFS family n=1 Tax=Tistlia consotensis USBA 355 TaxID=560819 RepID=A0A1Y6BCB2_9PROT|nr:MFS transporter [Tistlia consotensis]SMF03766.1 Predicted arabinose efflux permease, MFS family [Tistlia consotensis USBA 355]SNR54002.1 Predicted arabinose efflux permease, MFS family [Tistlia consotensis]